MFRGSAGSQGLKSSRCSSCRHSASDAGQVLATRHQLQGCLTAAALGAEAWKECTTDTHVSTAKAEDSDVTVLTLSSRSKAVGCCDCKLLLFSLLRLQSKGSTLGALVLTSSSGRLRQCPAAAWALTTEKS